MIFVFSSNQINQLRQAITAIVWLFLDIKSKANYKYRYNITLLILSKIEYFTVLTNLFQLRHNNFSKSQDARATEDRESVSASSFSAVSILSFLVDP